MLVAVSLDFGGTIVDDFVQINWWAMDQATAGFIDSFVGSISDRGKSRSSRSEVERSFMQQLVDSVKVVCCRWPTRPAVVAY